MHLKPPLGLVEISEFKSQAPGKTQRKTKTLKAIYDHLVHVECFPLRLLLWLETKNMVN